MNIDKTKIIHDRYATPRPLTVTSSTIRVVLTTTSAKLFNWAGVRCWVFRTEFRTKLFTESQSNQHRTANQYTEVENGRSYLQVNGMVAGPEMWWSEDCDQPNAVKAPCGTMYLKVAMTVDADRILVQQWTEICLLGNIIREASINELVKK